MMRRLPWVLLLLLFAGCPAMADTLYVSPMPIVKGRSALVKACLKGQPKNVAANFLGQDIPLHKGSGGCYYGPAAVPLRAKGNSAPMRIMADGRQVTAAKIKIIPGKYGVRRLTVSKKFNTMTDEQWRQYQHDQALIKAVFDKYTPRRHWSGPFIRPVPGKVVSQFGRRSIVNGKEKSPHGGVDLRGATGTPIEAPADGLVVVLLDHYFGGKTMVVDHGQGIVTCYLHLSKALVKQGQYVRKGDVIAEVGATGRVTGPHLHYGVVINGVKTDPLVWQDVSGRLAKALEGK